MSLIAKFYNMWVRGCARCGCAGVRGVGARVCAGVRGCVLDHFSSVENCSSRTLGG